MSVLPFIARYGLSVGSAVAVVDTVGNIAAGGGVAPGASYPFEVSSATATSIGYQRTGVSAKKWSFSSDNNYTYWNNVTDGITAVSLSNPGTLNAVTLSAQNNILGGNSSANPERGAWNPVYSAIAAGKPMFTDEEFKYGVNSVSVYNNAGGVKLVITREAVDTPVAVSGASWAANVLTVSNSAVHGLNVNDIVVVEGVTPTAYNGVYTVVSVPTTSSWTAADLSNPGAYTSGGTTRRPTIPNSTGYRLKIFYDGTGTPGTNPTPGYGGFIININPVANRTYVQRFRALIPTGYTLVLAENTQGTNNLSYWMTPVIGTGKYEEYIRVSHCGNTGSFSVGGHVYLADSGGGNKIIPWYLASANVYEIDNSGINDMLTNGFAVQGGTLAVTGRLFNVGPQAPVDYGAGWSTIALGGGASGGALDFYSSTTRIGAVYATATQLVVGTIAAQKLDFYATNARVGGFSATGIMDIVSTTASTSSTTGALTVAGGVGIGGVLNQAGGYAYLGNWNTQAYPTDSHTLATAWNFSGGAHDISIWNADSGAAGLTSFAFRQLTGASSQTTLLTMSTLGASFGSTVPLTILNTTGTSSTATGALIVSGGVGVAGSVYTGANIVVNYACTGDGIIVGTGRSSDALIVGNMSSGAGSLFALDNAGTQKFRIDATGNLVSVAGALFGSGGAAAYALTLNGIASGTNGGASVIVQNGGSSIVAIGNKSALLGGAYDATPMLYGNAAISTNQALNVGGGLTASAITATGGGFVGYYFLANGNITGYGANNTGLDYNSGVSRLMSFGATTSTYNNINLIMYSSNASVGVVGLSLAPTIATFIPSVVSNTIYRDRTGQFQGNYYGNHLLFSHSNTQYTHSIGSYSTSGIPVISFYSYQSSATNNTLKRASATNIPSWLEVDVTGTWSFKQGGTGTVDTEITTGITTPFSLTAAGTGTFAGIVTAWSQLWAGATATTYTQLIKMQTAVSSAWWLGIGDSSGTNFGIACDFGTVTIHKGTGLLTLPGGLTAAANIAVTGGSGGTGTLYYNATQGLAICAKAGSSYDFSLVNAANNAYAIFMPTGTSNLVFPSTTASTAYTNGAIVIGGGIGIAGAIFANSNASFAGTITGTQHISTVAIGTAPLVVTSTTVVPNLNASYISGVTTTDIMISRGAVLVANIDTAMSNGIYSQTNAGDSSGVLVWNAGGSLGPFQLRTAYQGTFEFRNKTDSTTWTAWKQVHHTGTTGVLATGIVKNTTSTGALSIAVAGTDYATAAVFTSIANGLAPLSGGGTTNFLRADGSWAAPTATVSTTDDTSTNATMYPVWQVTGAGANALKISTTKITFNPSTATLSLAGLLVAKQITDTASLGAELITNYANNGQFTAAGNWTLGTGWTVSGGLLNHSAGNATTATLPLAYIGMTSGAWYQITFTYQTITPTTGTSFYISFGAGTDYPAPSFGTYVGSGLTYTAVVYCPDVTGGFTFNADAVWAGNIDNISIMKITQATPAFSIKDTGGVSSDLTMGSGGANTGWGKYSLLQNVSGGNNTAFGKASQASNTSGIGNSTLGYYALRSIAAGNYNAALGDWCLYQCVNSMNNSALGSGALKNLIEGDNNAAVGANAGDGADYLSQCSFLGSGSDASNRVVNGTAIGYGAIVTTSNTIQLGNSSVTQVYTSGIVTAQATQTTSTSTSTGNINSHTLTSTAITAQTALATTLAHTPASGVTLGMYGIQSIVTHNGTSSNAGTDTALYARVTNSGSNSLGGANGLNVALTTTSTGGVSVGYGITVQSPAKSSTGAFTFNYGMLIYDQAPTGTVTSGYGIYINAMSGTNYAIYTAGAGLVKISDTTVSSSTGTGSVVLSGGIGIAGALFGNTGSFGGILSVTNSTASTLYSNGALVVTGGAGIGGNVNSNGGVQAATYVIAGGVTTLTPTTGSTVTINCALGNLFIVNLPTGGTAVTIGTPSNPAQGQSINILFTQGTTPTTLTWPANTVIIWVGGNKTITATASSKTMVSMVYTGGIWWASMGNAMA